MNNITIEIQLVRIKENRFKLLTDSQTEKILRTKGLQVGININTTPFLSENQIKLSVTINYHYINNSILVTPLHYTMDIWFNVNNLDEFIEDKGNSILIKHELLSMLLGVSIGTIGGMIAHRCKDTFLENYPLPIINVTHLMASLRNSNNTIENIDIPPVFLSKIH